MNIVFHESAKIFHLYNHHISYIMKVLPNGQMGQLYYGKTIWRPLLVILKATGL